MKKLIILILVALPLLAQVENLEQIQTGTPMTSAQMNRIHNALNAAIGLKLTNVLTTPGDMVIYTENGIGRIPKGSNGYCWMMVNGMPKWNTCPGGIIGAPDAWPYQFPPSSHAGSHGATGSDPVTVQMSQVGGLAAALAVKQNTLTTGSSSDYIDGTLALRPFPIIPGVSGSGLAKIVNGNVVSALVTDITDKFTGVGPCLYKDGTSGECGTGGGGGSAPAGAVGAIQINAGEGLLGAGIPGTHYVAPDDARLSNARTPTPHAATHGVGQSDALTPASIGAVATNDTRLTDSRIPLSHSAFHKDGGMDEVATMAPGAYAIPKAGSDGKLNSGWVPDLSSSYIVTSQKAAANGVPTLDANIKIPIAQIPTGSTSSTVVLGNDSRLSDARTPTPHALLHQNGGPDEIAVVNSAANAIPKAGLDGKLSSGWLPATISSNTSGTAAGLAGKTIGAGANIPTMDAAPTDAKCVRTVGGKLVEASGDCSVGGSVAGIGSELQYRTASGFGAVSGSSVSGSSVAITGDMTANSFQSTAVSTPGFLKVCPGGDQLNCVTVSAPNTRSSSIKLVLPAANPTTASRALLCDPPSNGVSTCSWGSLVGAPDKFVASFTCSPSITTFTADTHGRGTEPIVYFRDANKIRMEVDNVTLSASGDIGVTCATSQTVQMILSSASGMSLTTPYVFSSGTSISITQDAHGFSSTDLEVQVWDNSTPRVLIQPDTVSVDSNTYTVTAALKTAAPGMAVIAHR